LRARLTRSSLGTGYAGTARTAQTAQTGGSLHRKRAAVLGGADGAMEIKTDNGSASLAWHIGEQN